MNADAELVAEMKRVVDEGMAIMQTFCDNTAKYDAAEIVTQCTRIHLAAELLGKLGIIYPNPDVKFP